MNDRELLALVYFLQLFCCYLEVVSFKVLTDIQILNSLLIKSNFSRKEERWLHLLSQFNKSKVILKTAKIHVLGDALSIIEEGPMISNIHVFKFISRKFSSNSNQKNQTLGPLIGAMAVIWSKEQKLADILKRAICIFEIKNKVLHYENNLRVPR